MAQFAIEEWKKPALSAVEVKGANVAKNLNIYPTADVVLLVLGGGAVRAVVAEDGGGVHAGHALAVRADVELVGVRPAGGHGRLGARAVDGQGVLWKMWKGNLLFFMSEL